MWPLKPKELPTPGINRTLRGDFGNSKKRFVILGKNSKASKRFFCVGWGQDITIKND